MRGRDKFRKYKPALDKVSMIYGHLPAKVRSSLMIHTRNVKGLPGMANRYALVKSLSPMCGDNVSIHESFYFTDLKKNNFRFECKYSANVLVYRAGLDKNRQ